MEEEIIFEQPNQEQYYASNNQNINSESNRNLAKRIENAKDAIDIAKDVKSRHQGNKINKTPQNEIRNSDLNNDRELQKSKIENARKKGLANNNNKNNQLTNKLASKALASKGIPQPLADKMVNSELGQKVIEAGKKKIPALNALDKASKLTNKKTEETEKQEGNQEVISSQSMVKYGLIAVGAFVGFLFIILILIVSVSYLKTRVLGIADAVAGEDAGEKLEQYEEAYNYEFDSDLYVYNERTNKFSQNKLNSMNTLSIFSKRKYNESDLNELKEFFGSSVFDIDTKDMNTVYNFYFKLYDIYTRYSEKYNVSLDLPLLMSTLYLESDDVLDVFKSNTKEYDRDDHEYYKKISLNDTTELDLEYDWEDKGYKISNKHSDHDIEILAQYMVSKDSDGKYKVDNKKYKEFLREFIEKKYHLNKSKEYEFDNYIGNLGAEPINVTEKTPTSDASNPGKEIDDPTSEFKKFQDSQGHTFMLYKQNSKTYGSIAYVARGKRATIGKNGCGPTSISIVASGYGSTDNPASLVKTNYSGYEAIKRYFENNGYSVVYLHDADDAEILKKLNSGYKVILLVKSNILYPAVCAGYRLSSGNHWYTLLDVNGTKVYVADPLVKGGGWYELSKLTRRSNYIFVKK